MKKGPIPVDQIPQMDIREFREAGYLQEVNRRFLHPLGLALGVVCNEDGTEHLGGVWDFRDDPEGMIFDDLSDTDTQRGDRIKVEWDAKQAIRVQRFGWMVQPLERTP